MARKLRSSTEEFIAKAREVHGDKYSYEKAVYSGCTQLIIVTCPIHGDFKITPHKHVSSGHGCPECGKLSRAAKRNKGSEFIKRAKEIHGDKYDYSLVDYKTCKDRVEIICNTCGNHFTQTPDNHINLKRGCPTCGAEKSKKAANARKGERREGWTHPHKNKKLGANCALRCTTEEWIKKVLERHPDNAEKYDYSHVVYKTSEDKVKILCKTCGRVMYQKPQKHLQGQGCKTCAARAVSANKVPSFQEIVKRCLEAHGDHYEYFEDSYVNSTTPMKILHKKCGSIFMQRPEFHYGKGQGCPRCCHNQSTGEKDVLSFIKGVYSGVVEENAWVLENFKDPSKRKMELDIYLPELKLAVEYNGVFWHSVDRKGKGYHIQKRKACEKQGIRMLSIWECDWQDSRKRPIIERYLKNALGVKDEKTVYARKCTIKDVDNKTYRDFMDKNHIQGYATAKEVKKGLFTADGELVACMSFKILKNKDQKVTPFVMWDMVRYATSCNVPGGRSKLFKHIQKEFKMDHVQSFLDRDYFTGVSYKEEDGWVLAEDDQVSISFWSYRGGRMSRQAWWKSNIPETLKRLGLDESLYDPEKTQEWNAKNAGCHILENSGNSRFEWHSEEGKNDPVYLNWLKG